MRIQERVIPLVLSRRQIARASGRCAASSVPHRARGSSVNRCGAVRCIDAYHTFVANVVVGYSGRPQILQIMNALDAAFEGPDVRRLARFTPVGRDRERVFAALLEFTEQLAIPDREYGLQAQRVLDSIVGEPIADRPSDAHVIGECLGLVDAWLEAGHYARVLAGLPLVPFASESREVAAELQPMAASGRAFALLRPMLDRHGIELLRDGVMLLAASLILALARLEHVDHALAYARLSGTAPPGPAADGLVPPTGTGSDELLDFELSLVRLGDPHAAEFAERLAALAASPEAEGLRLQVPTDYAALLAVIAAMPNEIDSASCHYALHSYVHYRLREVDPHSADWAAAHALFPDGMGVDSSDLSQVFDAIDEAQAIPVEDLRNALVGLRPVVAVRALLQWIGPSRHTTAARAVRQGDIAEAAAMLGIESKGVVRVSSGPRGGEAAGLAAHDPVPGAQPPPRIYARSMWGVPALGHWWIALQVAGVIEVTATRVRPGPAMSQERGEWLGDETVTRLCAALVAEMLTDGLHAEDGWASDGTMHVLEEVLQRAPELLQPSGYRERPNAPAEAGAFGAHIAFNDGRPRPAQIQRGATRRIRLLLEYGLAEERDGGIVVPPLLRGIVAQGILRALDLFAREIDDEPAE